MKKISGYALTVFLCVLLIVNPQKSVYYATEGLSLCTEVIIPSLFPFFVCSGLLVYSGFCEVLARMLSPVMKPLFNINPTGATAFVLGLISGYPQGAVTTGQLYRGGYLSKTEAERLLVFCNNSGPLFLLGTVGIAIYHSPDAGIILYAAHILGAVSCGILFRFYKSSSYNAPVNMINTAKKSVSLIFSNAITDSVRNILMVCGSVLFCSVISKLFMDILRLNGYCEAVIASLLEFVSGLGKISYLDAGLAEKLLLSAAVCAFAGVSVHLQVMGGVSGNGLSLKPYIIGKVFHAAFAVLYTFILLKLIPVTQAAFIGIDSESHISLAFYICALCVLLSVAVMVKNTFAYICSAFRKRHNYQE